MFPTKRHQEYLVPKNEITNRIAIFQSTMCESDLSLAYISHPTDLYYYTGSMQNGLLLIPVEGKPAYFVKRSLKRAETESPLEVQPYPGRKRLIKEISSRLENNNRLGLAMDVTPASTYIWLLDHFSNLKIIDIKRYLLLQRAVKSDWELDQIKKAAQQTVIIFQSMEEIIRPAITEIEVSAEIEKRLRNLGHSGTVRIRNPGADLELLMAVSGDSALYATRFDGPVGGEGPYPASPPGAGWKKVVANETMMIDMVTSTNGYQTDNARTYFIGKELPDKVKQAHSFCLEVLGRFEEKLVPGSNCDTIYREVQSWIERQTLPEGFMGYGDNRVRFYGHGIGLELDEYPIIAQKIDIDLKPNMVLAMEPKAFIPGIGPVDIENTYMITNEGCCSLCQADDQIILLG